MKKPIDLWLKLMIEPVFQRKNKNRWNDQQGHV